MKTTRYVASFLALLCFSLSAVRLSPASDAGNIPTVSLSELQDQARKRITATPRVSLAPESAEAFSNIESLEPAGSGHVPNYLRAMASMPGVSAAFAHVMKTLLYGGDTQVFRIQFHRFAQVGNRLRGLAALAVQDSQQIVDAIILWGQIARPVESLRGGVIISLAQRQDSPVGPTRGLGGDKAGHLRQPAVGVHVVTHLQRSQADIERGNYIAIFFGGFIGKLGSGVTSRVGGEHRRQKDKQTGNPIVGTLPARGAVWSRATERLRCQLMIIRHQTLSCANYSLAPSGLVNFEISSPGSRLGLHSCAASWL